MVLTCAFDCSSLQRAIARADHLAAGEAYAGAGAAYRDRLRRAAEVSAAEVLEAARTTLCRDRVVTVRVGPESQTA